jgi:hypothetical protein
MILIFDTNSGLCNQMYDIANGIYFCLNYNIKFTFRYCSFRNKDLTTWTQQSFEKLFDTVFLNKYELYINYNSIKDQLTHDNCFNLDGKILAHQYFNNNDIVNQFIKLNKEYIVLKQFWSLYLFNSHINILFYKQILPSNHIMDKYIQIKNTITNQPYNFIHYRYENDFTNYFKCKIERLDDLLEKIKFKDNSIKTYIATSNIKDIINTNDPKYQNILYKNEDCNLNFEELAFIDYMIGLDSVECYGNSKSSFSIMINSIKNQNNYYQ